MTADLIELNFDGIVGPTHNFAGLSYGNVASTQFGGHVSRPRDAALQGLAKMRFLMELGIPQGVLPPQERPDVRALRRLGFLGSDREIIERAGKREPLLLALCSSASSMWAANAATVCPSADAADGRVHFTPANLAATFHRSLEPSETGRILSRVFPDPERFAHHDPVVGGSMFGDEGAANHIRLATVDGRSLQAFVFGRRAFSPARTARYPARQSLEASRAVARLHGVSLDSTVFLEQAPEAVDAGVFHNDVIAVGHENVLFHHEDSFVDRAQSVARLDAALGGQLVSLCVSGDVLTVPEAVSTYLFNSQIVTTPAGRMALIAPTDVQGHARARSVVDRIVSDSNPIREVHFLNVRESMQNGGGPACLRLRVPLTAAEVASVHQPCVLTPERDAQLCEWVKRHYRDELRPRDLADPELLEESRRALDELTQLLELGSLYRFQQA